MSLLHFEDIEVGVTTRSQPMIITREAIIRFAGRYDPQPIHLDEEAAKASIVGGLCASGFHTCCVMMRLLCDHWLLKAASLGAPGLDKVQWLKPVRPGDALTLEIAIEAKRVTASRPDVGVAQARYELINQNGDVVFRSGCPQMIRLRNPGAKAAAPREAKPVAETLDLWSISGTRATSDEGMYFEDRHVGELLDLGTHTFTAEEIIAFAREFDPQPFHIDEEAGRRSLFGGLAASGWHTAAHYIRLLVTERQRHERRLRERGVPIAVYGPSPGFENLRWLKPVLAGDTIAYRSMVSERVDLKSRPDRGLVKSRSQARNQRGEIVFDYTGMVLVERRARYPAGA